METDLTSKSYDPQKDSESQNEFILISAAQDGDLNAYDQLITIHRGKVFAMIKNMLHNEADAWDLSQEVFIKAWKALPKFEARAKFSTWVYRITHNVVYDWMRKRKMDSAGEFNDEILANESIVSSSRTSPKESPKPDRAMQNKELGDAINLALSKLSPEHREIVTLREIEGLDYKEIAEILECSMGTVMSRLFYARKKLQTLLIDERKNY